MALQRFRALQAEEGIECWDDQYIDDGVIECHSDDIDRTYANLEKALGPSGLRLNASKLHIWTPAGVAGPANVSGLTLRGKPIWQAGNSDVALNLPHPFLPHRAYQGVPAKTHCIWPPSSITYPRTPRPLMWQSTYCDVVYSLNTLTY
eukprot:252663-Amphidinium_carterae.8